MLAPPQQGNLVRVRSRLYLVGEVGQDAPLDDVIVHLSRIDEDAQAERLSVIWGSDVDVRVSVHRGRLRSRGVWRGVAVTSGPRRRDRRAKPCAAGYLRQAGRDGTQPPSPLLQASK